MKIAIPNNGSALNQHFGKSKGFMIGTIENDKIEKLEEVSTVELAHQHEGLADLLAKHNVDVVITGGIGSGALEALRSKGFKIIKGAQGECKDIMESYINGGLEDKDVMCNHHCDH
ncbi:MULTISPECIES: NifB/NifX family molybdenum-iron cluster-binding protein [Clostridium]|uniref:NifB/NifX family molybdenum-iron cluster-binding protein n=1 Tax=Clostridium TaxID=1485 RepID=UPI00069D4B03|nr:MULTISPECIES: NifB/NifX family molybdenum-iron cluster-binding protein [Clostridium]KOF56525.1 diguanylate cyclase [Clostridium sp. DMHC 10]MCD2348856.1 NifB/NifX family molybdenum-iron cluster-binding protein [Clostridium guangxiense]